jgi:hypothetical protein
MPLTVCGVEIPEIYQGDRLATAYAVGTLKRTSPEFFDLPSSDFYRTLAEKLTRCQNDLHLINSSHEILNECDITIRQARAYERGLFGKIQPGEYARKVAASLDKTLVPGECLDSLEHVKKYGVVSEDGKNSYKRIKRNRQSSTSNIDAVNMITRIHSNPAKASALLVQFGVEDEEKLLVPSEEMYDLIDRV